MTERIEIEPDAGEMIINFVQRMVDEVKRSDDPRNTIVTGKFNGITLNANVYTHKNYLLGQYDRLLSERCDEKIRKEKLDEIRDNLNRINSILDDIEGKP